MATPKVFVSSTCYDLKEIRDNLYEFIDSLGYVPVFSDKNDVFYHPDLHTHDSCIKEIESCQLFVLIIGGRFGGQYKCDINKSIVNAEYSTAKELKLPIVTFITRDVHSNHFMYEKNKGKKIEREIEYTSISDQKHASHIFEFINLVRRTDTNNAIFEFEFARDIRIILKKQFAGMFYDFLWNRKNSLESEQTNTLLNNLKIITEKTEEMIENIYRKVEPEKSDEIISNLDNEISAKKFCIALTQTLGISLRKRDESELKDFVVTKEEDSWLDYALRNFPSLTLDSAKLTDGMLDIINHKENNLCFAVRWRDTNKRFEPNENALRALENGFKSFKLFPEAMKMKIVNDITYH